MPSVTRSMTSGKGGCNIELCLACGMHDTIL